MQSLRDCHLTALELVHTLLVPREEELAQLPLPSTLLPSFAPPCIRRDRRALDYARAMNGALLLFCVSAISGILSLLPSALLIVELVRSQVTCPLVKSISLMIQSPDGLLFVWHCACPLDAYGNSDVRNISSLYSTTTSPTDRRNDARKGCMSPLPRQRRNGSRTKIASVFLRFIRSAPSQRWRDAH